MPPVTGIGVWWNLDAARWWSALRPAAVAEPSRAGPSCRLPPQGVAGGCRYGASFSVPAAAVPGRYRIVVLDAERPQHRELGPRWFTVLGAPDARVGLVTDSGLRINYPAAWYGQVVSGVDALISSTPSTRLRSPCARRPPTGCWSRCSTSRRGGCPALRGPRRAGRCGLAHFAPSYEGLGAAYRIAFTTRGHRVLVFVSLGDAVDPGNGAGARRAAGISADTAVSRAWIRDHGHL